VSWGNRSSLLRRTRQLAVLRQVADGFPGPPELLAQEREVVMAIGERGIPAQRLLVVPDGFLPASGVVEQDPEVVVQERDAAARLDPVAIGALGFGAASRLEKEPPEVHVGARLVGRRLDGALVGGERRLRIPALERQRFAEPVGAARLLPLEL